MRHNNSLPLTADHYGQHVGYNPAPLHFRSAITAASLYRHGPDSPVIQYLQIDTFCLTGQREFVRRFALQTIKGHPDTARRINPFTCSRQLTVTQPQTEFLFRTSETVLQIANRGLPISIACHVSSILACRQEQSPAP